MKRLLLGVVLLLTLNAELPARQPATRPWSGSKVQFTQPSPARARALPPLPRRPAPLNLPQPSAGPAQRAARMREAGPPPSLPPVVQRQRWRHSMIVDAEEKPIAEVIVSTLPSQGPLPPNYAAARFARKGSCKHHTGTSRHWGAEVKTWQATAFCHWPLYFEEINLERHGHHFWPIQPFVSAAHFFGRVPLLPYMAVADRPKDCQFTLGHYRPGSHAPFHYHRLPLRLDAAAVEAGVITGLVYLIP